uniref:Synaptonemal complex protein 1 n=1 Tax=Lygus hesperus TaxID=30085 RepID=A0A0A9WVA5_LYGHE
MSEMDLINQMEETQKVQEVKLEELKGSVSQLQEEAEAARAAKSRAECLLKEAQEDAADIEERYNFLLEESKSAKELYVREMNVAKKHWNEVELELKTTYEEIVGEMRRLEEQNRVLGVELQEKNEQLGSSTQNENFLTREVEKLKAAIEDKGKDFSILQLENEKNSNELHNCKMQLLKERNINDRLLEEVRRSKKELDIRGVQVEEARRDKDNLNARVEELIQASSRDRLLEIELKELKMSVNMILIGNTSLEDKLSVLGNMLKGDTVSVSVQTEMTRSDLDQYESLDRQATLMVMGLKEQMLNLKQQYLESRQENDVLKGFVEEVKREREAKEEGERVVRLEDAVRSLSEMVRAETYNEPTRESCILQALQDVKNDLNLLKARNRANKADQSNKSSQPPQNNHSVTSLPMHNLDPANRPVKLVTFRNVRP